MANKPIFRPAFGNRPDQLVGREETIEYVLQGITSFPGSAERAPFIMGQRGMGKTALLLEIADRAQELGFVVARTTCGETMLDNIVELLQRAGAPFVKDSRKPISGFNAGIMGFSVGLTFTEEVQRSFGFRVKLEMLCEKLKQAGKHVLILVDEVDPTIEQMRTLATTYQELAGDEHDVALVMAGLPSAVSDTLNYRTLTFFNRAQRITLDTVPVPEVEAYYHSAFLRSGIAATPEIVAQAAAATEGFPYLIQLIGYYLVKFAAPSNIADADALSRSQDAATAELESKVFQAMLNPLSDGDIAFLAAMAQDNGGTTTVSNMEVRLGLSHGTVQTYRKRLLDAGIITSPRRGELAFTLPALAGYLNQSN